MDSSASLRDLLATQSVAISVNTFLINLILAALLSFILNLIYVRYGKSLSNRQQFSRNFVLISLTTTLIITIVKSSLALSLGLVGALSIVRFRAAIKEPEELAYLFLAIAIGLGFGADQTLITIVAFVVICAIVIVYGSFQTAKSDQNLNLTISAKPSKNSGFENIVEVLKKNCQEVAVRRFDESKDYLEATFSVKLKDYRSLSAVKNSLLKLNRSIKVTFLENKNIS